MLEGIKAVAQARLAELRAQSPALTFIPNIGQERLLDAYSKPKRPFVTIIGAGNGMGKTSLMAPMMVGCAFGPDEVSEWMERYPLWQQEMDKRVLRGAPLQYRIVCHADAMKANGPVISAIKEWFPKGRWKGFNNGKTYVSQIDCYDPGGKIIAVFEVKTHDQDRIAHAGSNLDGCFVDEPMPEDVYGETIGRLRKDNAFMAMYLTPLEIAGWMVDQIIDRADGDEIVVTHGSLWDNCRDIPGTRGHLSRVVIERQIAEWVRLNPHELEARVYGTFTHLSGALFKNYTPQVHEVDDFPIPPDWPIYRIMDPHDSKAPALCWIAQSPTEAFVIREWPVEDYVKLGENTLTIAQLVALGRDIERPHRAQVIWAFMDPNKGKYRYNNSNKTVQEEYHDAGWTFELSEDDLQVGHQRVMSLLYYNTKLPIDENNQPYLRVFKSCRNTATALTRYGMKKKATPGGSLTANLDPKYKDFADLIRYFAMRLQPFKKVEEYTQFYNTLINGRVRK